MNQRFELIFRSAVVLLFSLAWLPLMANQNPLTVGINRDNGHLVATDIWSKEYQAMQKDSGHAVDEETGRLTGEIGRAHLRFCFVLGNSYDLDTNGTSLKGTMIIGYYHSRNDVDINSFIYSFWVSVSNDKTLIGETYYGDNPPTHINDRIPIRRLQIEALAHEKTKSGEVLWILKVTYRVELTGPVDFIPQITIQCNMMGGAGGWGLVTGKSQRIASFLDRPNLSVEKWPLATNTFTVSKPKPSSISGGQPKPSVKADLPGVTLSIKKTGEFLIITFSPVVPNASLEEANPSSLPWIWQPATGITNSLTNGWSGIPATESRVYRLKLD